MSTVVEIIIIVILKKYKDAKLIQAEYRQYSGKIRGYSYKSDSALPSMIIKLKFIIITIVPEIIISLSATKRGVM